MNDILYKPKYVIYINDRFKAHEKCYLYCALFDSVAALFQLEIYNIVKPNENCIFNINDIFKFGLNRAVAQTRKELLTENFKKLAKIYDFNILINVNDDCFICWPESCEEYMYEKYVNEPGSKILTYEEFMIKSLLE